MEASMTEAVVEEAVEGVEEAGATKDNVRQFQAKAQELKLAVNEAITKAADSVAVAAAKVGDQAKDVYGATSEHVQKAADAVDPFVKEKPYAALAIAGVAGLVLGLLFAGRGPRVI